MKNNVTPEIDPIRDLDEALRITGGSLELADELFEQFRDEVPERMAEIEALLQEHAYRPLRDLLHQVKGGAAVCAVRPFISALDALHDEIRKNGNEEQIHRKISLLRQRADELLTR